MSDQARMMGPHRDLPSTIVHKLCRLISGSKDLSRLRFEQRRAIFEAMQNVQEEGKASSAGAYGPPTC